jgi:hypothetical protein
MDVSHVCLALTVNYANFNQEKIYRKSNFLAIDRQYYGVFKINNTSGAALIIYCYNPILAFNQMLILA